MEGPDPEPSGAKSPPETSFVTVVSELGTLLACIEVPAGDPIRAEELHLMACYQVDPDIVPSTMWIYHANGTPYANHEAVTSEVVLRCRKGDAPASLVNNNNNEDLPPDGRYVFVMNQVATLPISIDAPEVLASIVRDRACELLGLSPASRYVLMDRNMLVAKTVRPGQEVKLVEAPTPSVSGTRIGKQASIEVYHEHQKFEIDITERGPMLARDVLSLASAHFFVLTGYCLHDRDGEVPPDRLIKWGKRLYMVKKMSSDFWRGANSNNT